MKRYYYSIAFTFAILLFSCLQIRAQNPGGKKDTDAQARQDEIEVTKFADAFLDSFIESKDLDKIPASFFEKDFKTRFVDHGDCLLSFFENEKIPRQNKYQLETSFHNFINLFAITLGVSSKKEMSSISQDEIFSKQNLPVNILSKFEKSKWLKFMLEDNSGEKHSDPTTPEAFGESTAEMSAISDEMRLYLRNYPVKTSPNFRKLKERSFKYYPADLCEGEACMGLPEKTPIFAVHELLMCLRIAKINNQWKVVQIYSVACED